MLLKVKYYFVFWPFYTGFCLIVINISFYSTADIKLK